MSEPKVPIVVDPQTGVWRVDGQPMVLIPRHFWVFVQMEIEKRVGVDDSKDLLFEATARAAKVWCEREAKTHGLSGVEVFTHYMRRVSERGLGQFTVQQIDPARGTAEVRIDHSVYVAEYGPDAGRSVCYTFGAAFVGGMEYVAEANGSTALDLEAEEIQCGARGAEHCVFKVSPRQRSAAAVAGS